MRRTSATMLIALLLLTASCAAGGMGSGQPATEDGDIAGAPEQPALSLEEAQLAYAQCMRDHGLDWPDPGPDGDTVIGPEIDLDSPAYNDAEQACSAVYDGVDDLPTTTEPIDLDSEQQQLSFAACMRDHGIDYPDPSFGEQGGSSMTVEVENEEAFDAAIEACRLPGSGVEVDGPDGGGGMQP